MRTKLESPRHEVPPPKGLYMCITLNDVYPVVPILVNCSLAPKILKLRIGGQTNNMILKLSPNPMNSSPRY